VRRGRSPSGRAGAGEHVTRHDVGLNLGYLYKPEPRYLLIRPACRLTLPSDTAILVRSFRLLVARIIIVLLVIFTVIILFSIVTVQSSTPPSLLLSDSLTAIRCRLPRLAVQFSPQLHQFGRARSRSLYPLYLYLDARYRPILLGALLSCTRGPPFDQHSITSDLVSPSFVYQYPCCFDAMSACSSHGCYG
jgi:hypothetical protein